MSRRYYNSATGIDLLPDVPTERVDDGRGSVVRGVLYASAISGSLLGTLWLVLVAVAS